LDARNEANGGFFLRGLFWDWWPDVYANQTVLGDPHREHISFMPFAGSNRMSIFDVNPDRDLRIAHYTHDSKTFDGFVFPRRRLIHLRDENGITNQKFVAITVQVSSVVRGERSIFQRSAGSRQESATNQKPRAISRFKLSRKCF